MSWTFASRSFDRRAHLFEELGIVLDMLKLTSDFAVVLAKEALVLPEVVRKVDLVDPHGETQDGS